MGRPSSCSKEEEEEGKEDKDTKGTGLRVLPAVSTISSVGLNHCNYPSHWMQQHTAEFEGSWEILIRYNIQSTDRLSQQIQIAVGAAVWQPISQQDDVVKIKMKPHNDYEKLQAGPWFDLSCVCEQLTAGQISENLSKVIQARGGKWRSWIGNGVLSNKSCVRS